jgi:glycosyltransferase involved in cell wall biosynthesis
MNETWPKISVVTPSYNQGMYLEETMLSVLSQKYPNLEYIVIDGGSSDQSVSIIQKYGAQLSYWESAPDRGFGHAINKGFSRATGEILCWLNSDDILLPGALLQVGAYFARHPNVGLVFGDRHIINERSVLVSRRKYFFYLPGQLRFAKTLPQECTFWRREPFEKVGAQLDEKLKFAIDLDLWCRLSKVTTFRHLPFFLGGFREQSLSKSAVLSDTGIRERNSIIDRYFGGLPSAKRLKAYQFWLATLRRLYRATGLEALKRRRFQSGLVSK